jgi:hypothetical protein
MRTGRILLGPLFVEHHPYGYGDKKYEEPWKQAVADECKSYWGGKPRLEEPVRLRLRFFLSQDCDYDLTGMLESTVNAIANAVFLPSPKGGHRTPWNYDDSWVYSIEASKEFGDRKNGVEITMWGL